SEVLAEIARGPKNPHARRQLVVWQDQSDGNWEIYARDLRSTKPTVIKLTDGLLNQENPHTDGRFVAWQGRQPNGNWDVFLRDTQTDEPPLNLTRTTDLDETKPAIDWPWLVYQVKPMNSPNSPWQLRARNLATGVSTLVWPSAGDQLDPDLHDGQVVWQDMRDPGPGEIYYANLETGLAFRVTTNAFGQYHPAIFESWIVWQDNRYGQVDIYGYDLLRRSEVRITHAPENEALPFIDGPWLVCVDDSLGPLTGNLKLIHLPSLSSVPITRTPTMKNRPCLTGNWAIWQETSDYLSDVRVAEMPSLQAVFNNRNTVAVTPAMAAAYPTAFALLEKWHGDANVVEITRFASFVPTVVTETASWSPSGPTGVNFQLQPGWFLWIRFDRERVIDLGINAGSAINLKAGLNVFSYTHFPSEFSAYQLIDQLGPMNVRSIRMLDSESGRWLVAGVESGEMYGEDFPIPKVAVLMVEMTSPVTDFRPR
ncbi:MAG: hypothetical protein N3G20_09525, partial [Verrucomicrobiae bacterium]|nr:hypothetical protein [Verrucomicrobiae bacterium]